MGKPKKIGLTKSLKSDIRNRRLNPSDRHTTASATKDYATLESCTQENNLDSFLRTADLANMDFTAEKLNLRVVSTQYSEAIPEPAELRARQVAILEHRENVRIPRRPPWTREMEKEELDRNEKDSFMEWRKSLAVVQENQHIILTPFEKNLEVWRQLWRVVERSDFVVQIVDARCPLFYHCTDLEGYVKEMEGEKENILLINKSDLLSEEQRTEWFKYFAGRGMKVVFYSAIEELESIEEEGEEAAGVIEEDGEEKEELSDDERNILKNKFALLDTDSSEITPVMEVEEEAEGDTTPVTATDTTTPTAEPSTSTPSESTEPTQPTSEERNVLELISRGEVLKNSDLLNYIATLSEEDKYTVGLIGYPNVGKSSTLNSLLREKRVQVSSTPGKTKHFQTFKLNIAGKDLTLCDCPGLVFPNLAGSKSEMICNGILPIDHMRDHIGPMTYLIDNIPKEVLESVYGITLPLPDELEHGRKPFPFEVLREYGQNRGFMTTRGTPDESRAARIILKDFVNGKLLYVHPPPGYEGENFNPVCERYMQRIENTAARLLKKTQVTLAKENVEENFFKQKEVKMHTKGRQITPAQFQKEGGEGTKPWKKHFKGNSKEKTRRKTADLNY